MHRKHLGSSLALVIALGLGTGLGTAPASAHQLPSAITIPMATVKLAKITTANLNLRQSTSTGSKLLLTIPKNTAVTVTKTSGSWSYTSYKGKSGWVTSSYLKNAPVKATTTYLYATKAATLRATASDKGKSLGTVPHRTKVQKLGTSGSFTKLKHGTKTGYLRTSGLSTKQPAVPKPPAAAKPAHRWTTANVNLRPSNSTKGTPLGTVPRGEKVTLVKSNDGWANAKTTKGTGWMSEDYLATSSTEPTPKPPAEKPEAKETYRWTTADVNLRVDTSTNKPSLGVVPKGEKLVYLKSSGGWANVKTSEGTGWIAEAYLSTKQVVVTPPTPPSAADAKYRWATAAVNVRSSGSTSGSVLGVLATGEKVTYIKSSGGWANIKSSKWTGWVSEQYLSSTVFNASPGLKPNAVKVKNLITMLFPYEVSSIGGVRQGSVGHSAGVALDLMIRNYKSPAGIKAGDKIAQYLLDNREELGIDYLIWRDKIWLSRKGWVPYSGGGYGGHLGAWNDTTLHNDHIHVETLK